MKMQMQQDESLNNHFDCHELNCRSNPQDAKGKKFIRLVNDFIQLPLACISNVLPKLNSRSILNYFHFLNAFPTMPRYSTSGDENITPIRSYCESANTNSTHRLACQVHISCLSFPHND